jgi:hypothetical protein
LVTGGRIMQRHADVLETDAVSGRRTGLAAYARRALQALKAKRVPHAVIGAAALAVRGLPRMTRDLDLVVSMERGFQALEALDHAGFKPTSPIARQDDPEPMYVLIDRTGGEVDLLVAAGEPELSVLSDAPRSLVFGVRAPVATLEQLLLLYLYSNQPKHLGDFARIVTETQVDLGAVERSLAEIHPEMLPELAERVRQARQPRPAPPRPPRRRSRR